MTKWKRVAQHFLTIMYLLTIKYKPSVILWTILASYLQTVRGINLCDVRRYNLSILYTGHFTKISYNRGKRLTFHRLWSGKKKKKSSPTTASEYYTIIMTWNEMLLWVLTATLCRAIKIKIVSRSRETWRLILSSPAPPLPLGHTVRCPNGFVNITIKWYSRRYLHTLQQYSIVKFVQCELPKAWSISCVTHEQTHGTYKTCQFDRKKKKRKKIETKNERKKEKDIDFTSEEILRGVCVCVRVCALKTE